MRWARRQGEGTAREKPEGAGETGSASRGQGAVTASVSAVEGSTPAVAAAVPPPGGTDAGPSGHRAREFSFNPSAPVLTPRFAVAAAEGTQGSKPAGELACACGVESDQEEDEIAARRATGGG